VKPKRCKLKVLISGSYGLIGSALVRSLTAQGHQVTRLVRPGRPVTAGAIAWDPSSGTLELRSLEDFDAVVHLAGENIASGRWTAERKQRIRDSRVRGTTLLCSRLKNLEQPPNVAVFASAIGYYGDRADEELDEDSPPGHGFVANLVREWEAASQPLEGTSIRVVRLRIGVVLSKDGGALAKMLPTFKRGLGGKFSSGRQYMSWITLDDLVGVIEHTITNDNLSGPVNAVGPKPMTNGEFTKTLGKVLSRPTLLSVPAFALHLAAGEMAEELLLASTRALPKKLQETGYHFLHPDLESGLRTVLGK